MKNLPLNMLRAFAAVYETGGVRPAARLLGVTHSSVSKFLNELEAYTGSRLIERKSPNRITGFTREGDLLGRATINALAELQQAMSSVMASRRQNMVVLETTPAFAARWLFPRLGSFELDHPTIELSVVVEQRVRSASEQEADFAIRLGEGPWAELECQPLMDDALYPVMSSEYFQKNNANTDIQSLQSMRLIHDSNPKASWSVWANKMGIEGLPLLQGPRYSSMDLVLRAAEQGLGVALARHQFVKEALQFGHLINPFGEQAIVDLPNSIWLVRKGHGRATKAAETVRQWLIAEAGKGSEFFEA